MFCFFISCYIGKDHFFGDDWGPDSQLFFQYKIVWLIWSDRAQKANLIKIIYWKFFLSGENFVTWLMFYRDRMSQIYLTHLRNCKIV